MDKQGVIVGSNRRSEWLLPWWWKHYARHNSYPVTFVDFGLSEEAAAWCHERGEVVSYDPETLSVASREEVEEALAFEWERKWGQDFWMSRKVWFCKPAACLMSPYETTIWLDLDCEVCGSLQVVFDALKSQSEVAVSAFPRLAKAYSSGMVVFRRDAELLQQWARLCPSRSAYEFSDDNVLSSLINTQRYAVQELPYISHCIGLTEIDLSALVLHWDGKVGKLFIQTHGGYQEYKEWLLRGADG